MSSDPETTRIVRSWLDEGVTQLPDRVLDAVLDQVPTTPQRRVTWWPARRHLTMNTALKFGLAAAVVVVAALLAMNTLVPQTVGGPGLDDATPTSAATEPASPTASATPGWPEGTLEAGRHDVSDSGVAFSFEVPEGWRSTRPYIEAGTFPAEGFRWILFLERFDAVAAEPCSTATTPVGPSIDDLANAMTTIPGTVAEAPVDATVGGLPAMMVELTLDPDLTCSVDEHWLFGSESAYPNALNSTIREWVFELDGVRYVIHTDQVGDDAVLAAEIMSIVESIEFD